MTRGRRILAARYLRTLATVETLIYFGNFSEAKRILNGIDQDEARDLASELEAEDARRAFHVVGHLTEAS